MTADVGQVGNLRGGCQPPLSPYSARLDGGIEELTRRFIAAGVSVVEAGVDSRSNQRLSRLYTAAVPPDSARAGVLQLPTARPLK